MSDVPPWAQQLLATVQQLQAQQTQLQNQLQAVMASTQLPPRVPDLPETVSAEAHSALAGNPFLEDQDRLYVSLLQHVQPPGYG